MFNPNTPRRSSNPITPRRNSKVSVPVANANSPSEKPGLPDGVRDILRECHKKLHTFTSEEMQPRGFSDLKRFLTAADWSLGRQPRYNALSLEARFEMVKKSVAESMREILSLRFKYRDMAIRGGETQAALEADVREIKGRLARIEKAMGIQSPIFEPDDEERGKDQGQEIKPPESVGEESTMVNLAEHHSLAPEMVHETIVEENETKESEFLSGRVSGPKRRRMTGPFFDDTDESQ